MILIDQRYMDTPQPEKIHDLNMYERRVDAAMSRKLTDEESAMRHQQSLESVYEIRHAGKAIIGYLAEHTNDPSHAMFADLRAAFNMQKPDVLFVEGIPELEKHMDAFRDGLSAMSDDAAIEKMGEPGFMLKLALSQDVPVVSPEYTGMQEIEMLASHGVSKEHIFGFYFFRALNQYTRTVGEKESFESRIARGLAAMRDATGWTDFDFSLEHANAIAIELWGEGIRMDPGYYNERVSHWGKERLGGQYSELNKVSAILNEYRDTRIMREVARALGRYDRVMIVYGASHLIELQPSLEYLLRGE